MVDRRTVEVYERQARQWAADRTPRDADHVAWVEATRAGGPVVDLGCGPGWSLPSIGEPRIGLDPAASMLALVAEHSPGTARIRAAIERTPVRRSSLGGAVANRVLVHLARHDVPLALADLHGALRVGAPFYLRAFGHADGTEIRSEGPFGGRLFSTWRLGELERLCDGAGFGVEWGEQSPPDPDHHIGDIRLRLRRAATLADTVGPGMRLLICGLNPSPHAAESGIGFSRAGNRFWPAAREAGLVSIDRDPHHALVAHAVGMTDLVKRATRRAAELSPDEFRAGLDRVEALATWLRPDAICFVGLAGWRAVLDRRAEAGIQDRRIGGRPVYLMPSTSGLNANATPAILADHLRAAADLADRSSP